MRNRGGILKNGRKRTIIGAVAALAIVSVGVAAGVYWHTAYQVPREEAEQAFAASVARLDARNAELDQAIESLQSLVASGDRPLDETLLELASQRIGEAQAARQTALEMPESADEINEAAKLMDSWGDYGTARDALASAEAELSSSIAQLKQITNPSEQFVIERLTGLPNVVAIEAVTEGNDPNGKLGKAGGYTATVYFSSDLVDQSSVYRTEGHTYVVGGGCDGGGAVEVFATEEDAQRRNEYLAILDGGLLASGSHAVYGTCVVRTSDLLAASQQKALEESIVASLTELR